MSIIVCLLTGCCATGCHLSFSTYELQTSGNSLLSQRWATQLSHVADLTSYASVRVSRVCSRGNQYYYMPTEFKSRSLSSRFWIMKFDFTDLEASRDTIKDDTVITARERKYTEVVGGEWKSESSRATESSESGRGSRNEVKCKSKRAIVW